MSELLEGYLSNIKNRNITFLIVFPEFFPKILEWHFILWKKRYSEYAKDKSKKTMPIVDSIIKFVTKKALVGQSAYAFPYFKTLDEHTQKYGDEFILGAKIWCS